MRGRGGHAAKGQRLYTLVAFPYLILIFKHAVTITLTKVGCEIVTKSSDWLSDRSEHLNMKYKLRTHKQFGPFSALRINTIILKSVQYLTCVRDVQPLNYMVSLVSLLWTSCMFSFFFYCQIVGSPSHLIWLVP